MDDHHFTLHDVISKGFEARCVGVDGTRYLWHGSNGLRVDPLTHITTLITDPAKLPEGLWLATTLGEEELEMMDPSAPRGLERMP